MLNHFKSCWITPPMVSQAPLTLRNSYRGGHFSGEPSRTERSRRPWSVPSSGGGPGHKSGIHTIYKAAKQEFTHVIIGCLSMIKLYKTIRHVGFTIINHGTKALDILDVCGFHQCFFNDNPQVARIVRGCCKQASEHAKQPARKTWYFYGGGEWWESLWTELLATTKGDSNGKLGV